MLINILALLKFKGKEKAAFSVGGIYAKHLKGEEFRIGEIAIF
jgi:hypothetical protein